MAGAAHLHPALLDLLERLDGTPALVITDLHVALVQNPLARALLGPLPSGPGLNASFVYRWFTDTTIRAQYHPDEHDHQSQVYVSDLRAVQGRRGNAPDVTELVGALHERSAEFAELWAQQDVAIRRSDRKRIIHPTVGVIELDCKSLLSEDGRQRLLWLTPPPGTPAVEQLELLAVVGTQDLEPDLRR